MKKNRLGAYDVMITFYRLFWTPTTSSELHVHHTGAADVKLRAPRLEIKIFIQ